MREPFVYQGLPVRVLFGAGKLSELAAEVERLGARRALVLSTPGRAAWAEEVSKQLGERAVGVFTEAAMHTPVGVTERAMEVVKAQQADCLVALGGGSSVGLAKAIALRTKLPQVAIPTTYAGSEVTPILGQTEKGVKTTQRSLDVLPETVIYDVELTLSLPPGLSAASGLNAIAHAVEALYAQDRNPIISLMAQEGIAALGRALPVVVERPDDLNARSETLYGAWLCGVCLGAVGMALHHKLCHVLGGSFDLPHAETHAVVLPHAVAYNSPAAPEAMARLAQALAAEEAATGLHALAKRIGAPTALRDLGMPREGVERAAELAVRNRYWNPRPLEQESVRDLIARAWSGEPPRA
jgi:maleylacetate reductase